MPLTFNDLKDRLQLSSGSTSQGLTWLRKLGAVREVELPAQRRTHYEAVAELRNLAGNFLRRQVATQFGESEARLAEELSRLKKMSPPSGDRPTRILRAAVGG